MDNKKFRELIDACRPSHPDLNDPEMRVLRDEIERDPDARRLFDRAKEDDQLLRSALATAPVPEGLDQRILEQLAESRATLSPTEPAMVDSPPANSRDVSPIARRPSTGSRSWRLVAWCSGAVAAAILLAILIWPGGPSVITAEQMVGLAGQWSAAAEAGPWEHDAMPVREYPTSQYVALSARRWQSLRGNRFGSPVVCYDLSPQENGRVLLFVFRPNVPVQLAVAPAPQPMADTQSLCVTVWQENGLVYALAVRGSSSEFRRLIRLPRPIACIEPDDRPSTVPLANFAV